MLTTHSHNKRELMETLTAIVTAINNFVWGPPMLVLILGTGLYLQLRLGLMPLRRIVMGFRMVWKSRQAEAGAKGEITVEGLVLHARPKTISDLARQRTDRAARAQVQIKERALRSGDLPGVGLDSRHPSALGSNRISKTVERISVPNDE